MREISSRTEAFLGYLKITPKTLKGKQSGQRLEELLDWSYEKMHLRYSVQLDGVSGEADPNVWNYAKNKTKLMKILKKGAKMSHMLGPVITIDENGENTLLDCYKAYPKNVELYLTPVRSLYHWVMSTATKDEKIQFRFNGEYYHNPLPKIRKGYVISMEEPISLKEKIDDEYIQSKIAFWAERKREHNVSKFGATAISNVNQIPKIEKRQLKDVYSNLVVVGKDFDYVTSDEILAISGSAI